MQRILLFRTVRTQFLNYCIECCRLRFPDSELALLMQDDSRTPFLEEKVDRTFAVHGGMISPETIPAETLKAIREYGPSNIVIPVSNQRLGFYKGPYKVALGLNAGEVSALTLDGKLSRLSPLRFVMRGILDSMAVKAMISFALLPYAVFLVGRSWIRETIERRLPHSRINPGI